MRIMLMGANGFIGRHILSDLIANGHEVVGVVRNGTGLRHAFPQASFIDIDLARATDSAAWEPLLRDVDIIVNAAGVLRGKTMDLLHVDMPRALYTAAAATGVKRAILLSAISARTDVATDYAQSKLAGEAILRNSGIGWTILRPSLVYADGSYGGTSLMRGMAAMPWLIPIPGRGDFAFSPIHARDLATAVRKICEDQRSDAETLEPCGPETLLLPELLSRYRAWLGFGRAPRFPVPMPVMRLFGRLGDLTGSGPIATNSLVQMIAGNAGDGAAFEHAIGFRPRTLDEALRDHPAQVQDRWHARLFFLRPAIKAILVLLWLASAWLGWVHGAAATSDLTRALGLPGQLGDGLRIGSSAIDIGIAGLLLFPRALRWATIAQLVMVIGYTLVIGIALPNLWLDPLGPLLKNLPIVALILVHAAIGEDR